MSLVNSGEMLLKASRENYAVGNFDVFNVEMIRGVLNAAEETRSPVILAFAEAFLPLGPLEGIAGLIRSMAESAIVPVVLHLDHAGGLPFIQRALKCGFTSVMIDASHHSLDENIRLTRQVVCACEPYGATVEAELGHVGGLEGQYENDDDTIYTDVAEAERFVRETGVDALAVAIGTVHGVYKSEPSLNLERLSELKTALGMPLVLHGASGLGDAELSECVARGVNKVNIYTDLMLAAMDCMRANAHENINYFDQSIRISDAVCAISARRMDVLGCAGRA